MWRNLSTKHGKGATEVVESYKVVYQGRGGELVEKKSKSVAGMRSMSGEEEVLAFAEEIQRKYRDARHHRFAYIMGDRGQTARCSDDGKPSQTVGKPMMDVLAGEGLRDVCAVVTRYSGGTLLSMSGLVRTYLGAAKAGLKDCVIVEKKLAVRPEVTTDYNSSGRIQYIAAQAGMDTLSVQYTDRVIFAFPVPVSGEGRFRSQITERTSGRAHIKKVDEVYYGMGQGKLIIF